MVVSTGVGAGGAESVTSVTGTRLSSSATAAILELNNCSATLPVNVPETSPKKPLRSPGTAFAHATPEHTAAGTLDAAVGIDRTFVATVARALVSLARP